MHFSVLAREFLVQRLCLAFVFIKTWRCPEAAQMSCNRIILIAACRHGNGQNTSSIAAARIFTALFCHLPHSMVMDSI
ncbi:MAG: hypothetical protein FWC40_05020 [Proteobacteria bacterium]|nr:hypothetical protein [Pseudomonadota bacterium]